MADTVNTNVLHNGTRRYVAQFLNQSDGTGESGVVKIDLSTLTGPDGTAPDKVSIQEVEWDIQGISAVKVLFGATADDAALLLNEGNGYKDFRKVGGLHVPQFIGTTGDVLFTTIGANNNGTYDIILHVKLHNEPRISPTAFLDFTQSHEPIHALPYGTGEVYKFSRESSRWLQVYDTDTQSLVWREIGANVVPMHGFYYADLNANGSPYDANGNLIPSSLSKGYHYGPGATNSLAVSRTFDGTGWVTTLNAPTITKNETGFDGVANSATTITDDNNTDLEAVSYDITVPDDSNNNLVSVFVGKDSDNTRYPAIRFRYTGGTTGVVHDCIIDTVAGTVNTTGGTARIHDFGDFWLVEFVVANNNMGNTTLRLALYPAFNSNGTTASDGTVTGSTVFDQAEIRLNKSFHDLIPIVTTGSAVTRLRDDYNLAIANHNQSEGMLLLEAMPGLDSSALVGTGFNNLISTFTTRNDGQLYYSSLSFNTIDDANNVADINHGGFTAGDTIKPSVRWGNGTMTLVLNGSTDTAVYSGAYRFNGDHLSIFRAGIFPWYIKSLRYYQRDLGVAWIQGQQS